MRISKLVVENFRSIRQLEVELPQICALVGPNNSGKSNILLAIQQVLGRDWVSASSFDEDDVYGRDSERDVTITLTLEPSLEYRKFKGSSPVEISGLSFEYTRYKVGAQKGQRRLEQKCFDAKGRPPLVPTKAPKKGEKSEYQPLVNIPSEVRDGIPVIFIGTSRALKDQLPNARYSLLRQLLEDVDRDFRSASQLVKVKRSDGSAVEITRSERFRKLLDVAMDLLRTDSFRELENEIKRNALAQLGFDPDTEADELDLSFSPFTSMDFYRSLDMQVREGSFTISATELGEGVQNAIVLAILRAFEARRKQGAILLIEEPEMFLHPQMQRSLYQTLRHIGKTNQVIYTTHSPHFVSVAEFPEILLVRKTEAGTTVRRSGLPADPPRQERFRKEMDPERNELFFAKRALFVEGDTEKF